jgi:serine/threonine-protein kinase RsbT
MPVVRSSAAEIVWDVSDAADPVALQATARRLAGERGFDTADGWRLAIAASEVSTNILKYAGRGTVVLSVDDAEIRLHASDQGPGYGDVREAMKDHVSQGKDVREEGALAHRSGLGTGLGAVQRLLDEVRIENGPEGGAHVGGVLRRRP